MNVFDKFYITSIRVYLHYHDYILDGRWVVTENIDSDDKSAVVRNKGEGWDDEECPEKETYQWELRSRRGGICCFLQRRDFRFSLFLFNEKFYSCSI